MTIQATPRATLKRVFPHVTDIKDWPTGQTTKLIWERLHDLEERLQAAQATITTLVAGHNTNEATIASVGLDARQALVLSQQLGAGGTGAGAGAGAGTLPGGGDGGGGNIGCSAAGPSGHDTGGLLNPIRAGQIVCGTGNEFAALKNVTATLAARQANAEELVLRMIWHLREAGFSAGRQMNPSGLISNDKLCVVVDGVTRAYDVFIAYDDYTIPLVTSMGEVSGANLQDDAGTPD